MFHFTKFKQNIEYKTYVGERILFLSNSNLHENNRGNILPKKIIEVIVILILECVMNSHNSPSMYQNFKIVSIYALC